MGIIFTAGKGIYYGAPRTQKYALFTEVLK